MNSLQITEITIKMLIDSGILEVNTKIYSNSKPVVIGTIDIDGLIQLKIGNELKKFPYLSGAARAVVNLSVNGWKFWRIERDKKMIELSELRKVYVQKTSNNLL
jgi:hypothetical protein